MHIDYFALLYTRYWLVFGPPPPPFIVASLRHTCAIITLSNQHLDMPHLWGGWIISFTNTDLDRFVNNITEKKAFCVHRKSLRSLSSAHDKWSKNKCCVYNFDQCIYARYYILVTFLTSCFHYLMYVWINIMKISFITATVEMFRIQQQFVDET